MFTKTIKDNKQNNTTNKSKKGKRNSFPPPWVTRACTWAESFTKAGGLPCYPQLDCDRNSEKLFRNGSHSGFPRCRLVQTNPLCPAEFFFKVFWLGNRWQNIKTNIEHKYNHNFKSLKNKRKISDNRKIMKHKCGKHNKS